VDSVDDMVTILVHKINNSLEKLAPYKSFAVSNKSATPWITDECLEKMDEKGGCKNTFNKTGGWGGGSIRRHINISEIKYLV